MFPKHIAQLHLVAACFDETDMPEQESYLADFTFDPVGLPNLEKQVDKIFLYHSKDDPVVYFSHVQKFKDHLPKAKVTVFEDRGHFRQAEFPELLENISR
jgi:predicted alpha/beta hydrolase family esterase